MAIENGRSTTFSTTCPSCMQEKGEVKICKFCGYDEDNYEENPLYIKPRTLLKNQYLIGEVIGQGGFGITYVGMDINLRKKVAIKEYLPTNLAARAGRDTQNLTRYTIVPWKSSQQHVFRDGLQSFLQEARKVAEFNHDNIVRIINFFEENGTAYIVMEYLEGDDLSNFLKKQENHRLPVTEALTILYQVLDALKEIHSKKLFHQDVSAPNIRIVKGNKPVLIDFGAARYIVGEASHLLEKVYRPGYSPWEQMMGTKEIGPWTDIYACGATFYLMLTGQLPPISTSRFDKDTFIEPKNIEGLNVSLQLNQVILQALAVRVSDRFQSVDEFKEAILKTESRSPSQPPTTKKYSKYVTYTLAGLVALVTGSAIYYFLAPDAHGIKNIKREYAQGDSVSYIVAWNKNNIKQLTISVENNARKVMYSDQNQQGSFSTANWPVGEYLLNLNLIDQDGKSFKDLKNFHVIDKTLPSGKVTINSPEAYQGEEITYSISAHDNVALKNIKFAVKGTTINQAWDVTGTEISQKSSFSTKDWSSGAYSYKLTVADAAGNESIAEENHFTLKEADKVQPTGTVTVLPLGQDHLVGDKITFSIEGSDDKELKSIVFSVPKASIEKTCPLDKLSFKEQFEIDTARLKPETYSYSLAVRDKFDNLFKSSGEFTLIPSLADRVATLLKKCDKHLKEDQLTSGDSGSAWECYQEVLQLDGANTQAKEGLKNIEVRYHALAKKALQKNPFDYHQLKGYLEGLEKVNSQSPELQKYYFNASVKSFELGQLNDASQSFIKRITLQVNLEKNLALTFYFARNSDDFPDDVKEAYLFWLHQIAEYLKGNSHCIYIVGHATRIERSEDGSLPLLRAQKIQKYLKEHFSSIEEKSKIVDKGSQSEEGDFVGFEIVDCSLLR